MKLIQLRYTEKGFEPTTFRALITLFFHQVDMVPEMNATMDAMSKVGVKEAVKVFLLQNIGIMSGIVSLFVLARFQDDILIQM